MLLKLGVLLSLTAIAACSMAHHGKKFFLVTELTMPGPGEVYALTEFTFRKKGRDSAMNLSPGFLVGVCKDGRGAIELHGHLEKEGSEKWNYEATGIEFRHALPFKTKGWGFTASIEAELPRERGATAWTARLIAGREDEKNLIVANLIAENHDGLNGKTEWQYFLGWSPNTTGPIGYGIELGGELQKDGQHELLVSASKNCGMNSVVKLGLGVGLTKNSPDYYLHFGFVTKL